MTQTREPCPHTAEVPHSRDARPQLTKSQVRAYMQHIGLPEPYLSSPVLQDGKLARQAEHGLPLLSALVRHHVAAIPFENLVLQYSQYRVPTLDTDELFERIVGKGQGLGGYCFQQNAFFGCILRSLGYTIMASAARTNTACESVASHPNFKGPSYNPWNHMINIVTISSVDYLVDVGVGAWGPTTPVELKEGETVAIAPRTLRLLRACIPEYESCRESNRLWHLEACNGPDQPWVIVYSFSLLEFLPIDFQALSWYVSTNRRSWFTQQVICSRLILDDDSSKIVGDATLYEKMFRKRMHGKAVFELELKSEEARVAALAEHFNITLSACEQDAILGTAAQIP